MTSITVFQQQVGEVLRKELIKTEACSGPVIEAKPPELNQEAGPTPHMARRMEFVASKAMTDMVAKTQGIGGGDT